MKQINLQPDLFNVHGATLPSIPMEVPETGDLADFVPGMKNDYVFSRDNLLVMINFLRSVWKEGAAEGLQLIGPTGSGKTSLPEQVCARLGVPLISVTGHDRLEVDDLIYQTVATGGSTITLDGPLTVAMRAGVPFLLNEIDLLDPGTLTGLNDIIERGFVLIKQTNELVKARKGFCFIVTSNTAGGGDETGLYVGTRVQNLAFRDRFQKLVVGYPEPEVERRILVGAFKIQDQVADSFVKVANMIRSAFEAGRGMDVTMSTRTLTRWVNLAVMYQEISKRGKAPVLYAVDLALANGTSPAVMTSIHEMITQVFGVSDPSKAA